MRKAREGQIPREEQDELIARWQAHGDVAARNRVVEANLGLVGRVVVRYLRSGIPGEDLWQEGVIGLMRALDTFDSARGWKLSTYAQSWVKQHITKYILDTSRTVRVPVNVWQEQSAVRRGTRRIERRTGRAIAPDEREALGVAAANLRTQSLQPMASLDQPMTDSGETLANTLPCKRPTPEEQAIAADATRRLARTAHRVMAELPERERAIVQARYLEDEKCTLADAAMRVGRKNAGRSGPVTRERARQLEVKALKRLRKALEAEQGEAA